MSLPDPRPARVPTLGRIVLFRSRTGHYTCPAMIVGTARSLNPRGVDAHEASDGEKGVAPLSSSHCVHLVVFTPGMPGQRVAAEDFVNPPSYDPSENVSGCYQEWDVEPAAIIDSGPQAGEVVSLTEDWVGDVPDAVTAFPAGTWAWPLVAR